MSKLYTSKRAGYSVLSGGIKSISEDRMSFVVTYREYDPQAKKAEMNHQHVATMKALPDSYKKGDQITVLGGIMGQTMQAVQYSNTSACFEVPMMSVISGMVEKVRVNEEKNADGTPKTRRSDGAAKKPHLDIFVTVNEESKETHHIIKVYNGKYQDDVPNIEKYQTRFAGKQLADGTVLRGFENAEETPIRVTICTQPGHEFAMERDDGSLYYGCNHLGINSIDLDYQYKRTLGKDGEKTEPQVSTPQPAQEAPVQQEPAPQAVQQAPATPVQSAPETAPQPQPTAPAPAPVQEPLPVAEDNGIVVNGFDEDMSLDFT